MVSCLGVQLIIANLIYLFTHVSIIIHVTSHFCSSLGFLLPNRAWVITVITGQATGGAS